MDFFGYTIESLSPVLRPGLIPLIPVGVSLMFDRKTLNIKIEGSQQCHYH